MILLNFMDVPILKSRKASRLASLVDSPTLLRSGVAQHPGVAQRRREDDFLDQRVDDLVAALILLQLDLGLRRLQELHRAGNADGRRAFAILIGRRVD